MENKYHLLGLSEFLFNAIEDQFVNNDTAPDEEIYDYLVELGVSELVVKEAMLLRDSFLTNPFAKLIITDDLNLSVGEYMHR